MSNRVLTSVFEESKSRGVARLVLLAIADRADDHGRAYPGTADICRRANCSRRAVISARQELVELGELIVEKTGGSSDEGKFPSRYRINLKSVQGLHQCGDCTSADSAQTGAGFAPEPVQGLHPNPKGTQKNHREKKPAFVPPSRDEAIEYGKTISLPDSETEKFHDHFTSNGWKVGGKAPMQDWKAAMRNWKHRSATFGTKAEKPRPKFQL